MKLRDVPLCEFDSDNSNGDDEDDRYEDQKQSYNTRIDAHQNCIVDEHCLCHAKVDQRRCEEDTLHWWSEKWIFLPTKGGRSDSQNLAKGAYLPSISKILLLWDLRSSSSMSKKCRSSSDSMSPNKVASD